MARPRILPDKAVLASWRREGLTHQQMADRVFEQTGHRVTSMAISVAMHRYGEADEPVRYDKEIPWRVRTEHAQQNPVRMLRLLARRRRGDELNPKEATSLDNWLKKLEKNNAVVAYDPETGFHYVERIKGDGRAIPIRLGEVSIK